MKKFLLISVLAVLMSTITSIAQESEQANSFEILKEKGHNAIELSGGYGIDLLLDKPLQDKYLSLHGLRVNAMIRPFSILSIGGYYSQGEFVTNTDAPSGTPTFSKLAAELRLRIFEGCWIYGRYGTFKLENFLYLKEKVSTEFQSIGLRFETNKNRTISIFVDGTYNFCEFEEIEYPMESAGMSLGLCLNF